MMKRLCAFLGVFSALLCCAAPAALRFDLSQCGWEKLPDGNYLWRLSPAQNSAKVVFDLENLGVRANDYDEIRILFRNRKGVSMPSARVTNYPSTDQIRNWYAKTALPENQWIDQRFDLRLDDDGWWFGKQVAPGHNLELSLFKKFKRTPGEPPDREVEIAAVELIRRKADLTHEETGAVLERCRDGAIRWHYTLRVQNRESVPQSVTLELATGDCRYFKPDWTKKILNLKARETRNIPLTMTLGKADAEKLSPLYSERVLPKLILNDAPPVWPLIGYRPRYLWATLPPESLRFTLPVPEGEAERRAAMSAADAALVRPFAVPPQQRHAQYCAIFKPREMEALSFYRIRDRKSGKDLSDNLEIVDSYIYHHNEQTFKGMKQMAVAFRMTGNIAYAEKIRDILLEYAYWFDKLPPRAPSSTSGGSRLTSTTLDLCYFFADGVEAYVAVRDSGAFGNEDRERIESGIFAPLMMNLYSHDIEFTNMQLHHIGAYGSAAIMMERYWNLLGDALYGDHGFYSFVRDGFTADGIALEGGVYHPFGLLPLLEFTARIRNCGIELVNEPFKRIFDHGIVCTPSGIADANLRASYPVAWQRFRDPRYLPTLKIMKKLPPEIDPKNVPDSLEQGNTLQPNNGYLWLREQSPAGFRALAINYIMPWDRMEHDRLHFRLFDGEGMLSHEVHRVGYTNPGADMEATVSHNTVVVDEKSSEAVPARLAAFLDRPAMPGALFTERSESRLYPGIDFSRAVAIFDGIFFVGDLQHAADGKTHSFDWPFYAPWQPWAKPDAWKFTLSAKCDAPFRTAYKHVASANGAPAGERLTASVDVPPSTPERGFDVNRPSDRRLVMHAALPFPTTVAELMIGRGHVPKPGPVLMLRQQGGAANFGVAFEVVTPGAEPRVKGVRSLAFTPEHPLSAVWEIETTNGRYLVMVNRTGTELKCGDDTTRNLLEVVKR